MASNRLCGDNYHGDENNVQDIASAPQTFCYQTIPTASSSDNLNQNVAPSTLSDDPNYQEVSDVTSNAVINFIGQMMLEEDIDDGVSFYHNEAALRETENSFYNLLGKEYPLSPALIKYHTPQNSNNTKSSFSSTSEPPLTRGDPTSALSMENLPASQFQKGVQEAMKFLPDLEKLFIGLNPNKIEFHEEHNKINVIENKATCSETSSKKCSRNDREPDISEGRARKQQAVSSDEPAGIENLDKFLLSSWREYVKEVTTVQEIMKQEMKSNSWEHQMDTMSSKMALEMKETEEGLVDLRSLLLHCSEAISANNYSRAYELINQIKKHASPKGDCSQRVAYYLVDALEARLAGTRSDIYHELLSRQENVTDYLKAFRVYHATCPFMRATHYFSNQTILNISKNATKIHIIDFGIQMGFLWPSFFERLSKLGRTPPKIRITGIEFPQKGFRPRKLVEETGRRLSEYAQRFNIRLKYHGIASNWENIKIEDLNIERNEALVVNCIYRLESLADETIDISCPRDKVLRMIREINPNVFIHGIHNGSYGTPFFTSRFKEVVSRCSSFFDMFESNMPRGCEARFHIERTLVIPKAINAVACEGSERVDRPETYRQWQARNARAGFLQLPLDSIIKKKIEYVVRELYHKEFIVVEDNKWLLLGWKGVILFGLSTWIPNKHKNVDSKTT